jgi:hypothetical protein
VSDASDGAGGETVAKAVLHLGRPIGARPSCPAPSVGVVPSRVPANACRGLLQRPRCYAETLDEYFVEGERATLAEADGDFEQALFHQHRIVELNQKFTPKPSMVYETQALEAQAWADRAVAKRKLAALLVRRGEQLDRASAPCHFCEARSQSA